MDKTKYHSIFDAFEKAPLGDFLKVIFKGITPEQRKSLIIEDVSYHRFNPDIVTLEAWICMDPIESDQWIWVRVEKDNASGSVQGLFYTKDSYRKQTLSSLQECLEYYEEKGWPQLPHFGRMTIYLCSQNDKQFALWLSQKKNTL